MRYLLALAVLLLVALPCHAASTATHPANARLLYVAEPGIRNYLEYGGHGVLVFDIDHDYKFLRRIAARGLDDKGVPENVKGICANAATNRLYVSTLKTLTCFDLTSDAVLWEKSFPAGCDRMAISPDGKTIYLPSFESTLWYIVDALTGNEIKQVPTQAAAHNTICSLDGSRAFLADRKSPVMQVLDTRTLAVSRTIPFGNFVRPFTINSKQTLVYACVNDLLGFEVADLSTGKLLHRVEVKGFTTGDVKRHGCPSHGIGLTPDEKEIWLCDSHNKQVHIFDNTTLPAVAPQQLASITCRDEPGWITFSLDGKHAWPSTGEVIDVKQRKVIATLTDEEGRAVQSEKVVEVQFKDGKPSEVGDQFGLGRAR